VLKNTVYLCGPTWSVFPCPRCGNRAVLVGMMAPPECDLTPCGWDASVGPEEWGCPGEAGTDRATGKATVTLQMRDELSPESAADDSSLDLDRYGDA
jgi:hypothetical protein